MFRDWFSRFTPLTPSSQGWLNLRQRGCQCGMGFSCGLRCHNLARRLPPGARCRHARLPKLHGVPDHRGQTPPGSRKGALALRCGLRLSRVSQRAGEWKAELPGKGVLTSWRFRVGQYGRGRRGGWPRRRDGIDGRNNTDQRCQPARRSRRCAG